MRDLEKLRIEYVGHAEPKTRDEVELEILGLEVAIKGAERRIAMLKQGLRLGEITQLNKKQPDEDE